VRSRRIAHQIDAPQIDAPLNGENRQPLDGHAALNGRAPGRGETMATIDVTVNGEPYRIDVPDHWTLMDLLRDRLELTGTKDGCSEGVCGACSVWLDGRLVRACLTLARRVDGREVATVEGLDAHGTMSGLQRAFVEHGAIQCGFCTPGMLMAGAMLLRSHADPSEDEIREFLAGNLCRCTGYAKIVAAVRSAARAAGGVR
jgi:carbon-monoxide dehydrogenase small subunit